MNTHAIPKIISRQQTTMSHLSQPKSSKPILPSKNHVRPNQIKTPTVEELFGRFDKQENYEVSLPMITERSTTKDKRFQRLIHLFSDVHERKPSTAQSVETLIQINPALQHHPNRYPPKKMSTFDLIEEDIEYIDDIRSISIDSRSDFYTIEACA